MTLANVARHHHHPNPTPRRPLSYFSLYPNRKGRPPRKRRAFLLLPSGSITMNLDFEKSDGLVTAVIQDHASGRVLMVGFMNEAAFRKTVETGFATFGGRPRRKLWLKGESSGHRLAVKEISDRKSVV